MEKVVFFCLKLCYKNCELFLPAHFPCGCHFINFKHFASEACLPQAGETHSLQFLTLIYVFSLISFLLSQHCLYRVLAQGSCQLKVLGEAQVSGTLSFLCQEWCLEVTGPQRPKCFSSFFFGLGCTLVPCLRRHLCWPVGFCEVLALCLWRSRTVEVQLQLPAVFLMTVVLFRVYINTLYSTVRV